MNIRPNRSVLRILDIMKVIYLSKKEILQENGTYNKNYKRVKDARFSSEDFFDPMDVVQVKYEMLKDVEKNGKTVSCAADDYGFSRTAYYSIKEAFDNQGVVGLIPEKPGPRAPHKLTPEYQQQIDDLVSKKPWTSSGELAEALNENNAINISKRTVERYRAKKKQY